MVYFKTSDDKAYIIYNGSTKTCTIINLYDNTTKVRRDISNVQFLEMICEASSYLEPTDKIPKAIQVLYGPKV